MNARQCSKEIDGPKINAAGNVAWRRQCKNRTTHSCLKTRGVRVVLAGLAPGALLVARTLALFAGFAGLAPVSVR